MMKRMVLATLVGIFCLSNNLRAMDGLRNGVVRFGEAIEKVDNVPLIDKLTNLLPFAMVAACFKECPGQTMVVLTGLLFYVLSKNESVRSVLKKYRVIDSRELNKEQINQTKFDETLFVFDGEEEEDAQEEIDAEDELFTHENDAYFRTGKDDLKADQPAAQSTIKFL